MTLIKSISGIRGTIGGKINKNLTPFEVVKFGCAYGVWLKRNSNKNKLKVVIGRDARISGEMIQNFVQNSLISLGINVIDLGLSTTPTVELMVKEYHADGGIIITASHNPAEWNALKLLDKYGEFLDNNSGEEIVKISESDDLDSDALGEVRITPHYVDDKLLWTGLLASIPAFIITGVVLEGMVNLRRNQNKL